MKKWTLRKKTRQGAVAVLFIIIIITLAGVYWSYTRPAETAVGYTAFPYSQESKVDYQVYLLPNELYEETYLGPGRAYISRLTDYINTEFMFRFWAEDEADINGRYSVIAKIEALTGRRIFLSGRKVFSFCHRMIFISGGKKYSCWKILSCLFPSMWLLRTK